VCLICYLFIISTVTSFTDRFVFMCTVLPLEWNSTWNAEGTVYINYIFKTKYAPEKNDNTPNMLNLRFVSRINIS